MDDTAPFVLAQVIRGYTLNRLWISGFLLDTCGAALMLIALSQAPVRCTLFPPFICDRFQPFFPSQGLEFKNLSYTIVKKPDEAQVKSWHAIGALWNNLRKGSIGWARAAEPTGYGASLSPSMTRFGIARHFNATSSAVSEAVTATSSGAVHAVRRTDPIVSVEWLHANLRDPDVKIVYGFKKEHSSDWGSGALAILSGVARSDKSVC
ncbi:hypothetical protein ZWY2020_058077 [Hordeum vulgare]|nr:hypothetical protein ZWY2020_058077 [Hordeum vulgare]